MRLTSIKAESLNNSRDIAIEFEDDVTFLTGVNGCGKTAILRALNALLAPNLEALSALDFTKIQVEFVLDGKKRSLSAQKRDAEISISASHIKRAFNFDTYEEDAFSYADSDAIKAYYREVLIQSSNKDPVLQFLSTVPTPMYLGLDRRHAIKVSRMRRVRPEHRSRKRNVFSSPLGDSLSQAVALAEEQFAKVRYQTSVFDSEFNRDLLLSLLDLPQSDPFELKPPTDKDRALIERARRALLSFPRVEGISAEDIRARLDPALADIGKTVEKIPKGFTLADFSDDEPSQSILALVLEWVRMKPLLLQVTKVADLVTSYNEHVKKARSPISEYSRLIDDFYNQTGKTIGFSSNGRIEVRTKNSTFGVDELSSGEAQIFVILTHLAFNPHASEAGVFIIDEPELSLHLLWQDMLIQNMMQANSEIQYIMATHSPAIIGELVEKARDLTPA